MEGQGRRWGRSGEDYFPEFPQFQIYHYTTVHVCTFYSGYDVFVDFRLQCDTVAFFLVHCDIVAVCHGVQVFHRFSRLQCTHSCLPVIVTTGPPKVWRTFGLCWSNICPTVSDHWRHSRLQFTFVFLLIYTVWFKRLWFDEVLFCSLVLC